MAAEQSGASASEEIEEGSLSYWTTVVNKWQNRWCVLKEDGYLYYYAVSSAINTTHFVSVSKTMSSQQLPCTCIHVCVCIIYLQDLRPNDMIIFHLSSQKKR